MMTAMIRVDGLCLAYDGVPAVQDVSFEVQQGDFFCIVGENGSGKSTLIKGLLGLLPAAAGHVLWGMEQRTIGYLPQQTALQRDFPANVIEVVLSGCQDRHKLIQFYSRADKVRAAENLRRVQAAELARRSYRELSGGQQQRVLLARALCAAGQGDAGLLLLDEPMSGLDPVVAAELYALLRQLNQGGMTVVMISHDIRGAITYGNRILHLRKSALFAGDVAEYVGTALYRRMTEGGDVDV